MPILRQSLPGRPFLAVAVLLAAGGCVHPLSLQDEYFTPWSGNAVRIGGEVQHAVSRGRALQAVRNACGAMPDDAVAAGGPDLGFAAAGRRALAGLCTAPGPSSVAAYGAAADAYRRWAEDEVRELPEVSATAGLLGGS